MAMKKLILIILSVALVGHSQLFSQDKRALRAAEMSYSSAESDFKNGKYAEALQKYDIVVNTIPASIPSRKHLEMRLESIIKLIDIRFYKSVNITQACEYLDEYNNTMSIIKNSGVLKSSDLLGYLKKEQEYAKKEATQCAGYERIGKDMDKFRKKFEEEMDEK
jgi:outer membrane protein assembly factor BamD (BamD/ComL family)